MNNGGSDGTSCFKVKIRTDTTKLTNARITRFKQCRDLVRESEIMYDLSYSTFCVHFGLDLRVFIEQWIPRARGLGSVTTSPNQFADSMEL